MAESKESTLTSDATRAEALARLLDEVIRRRHQGEHVPDAQIIAEHPELMPELQERLRQLSLVQKARVASDQTESMTPMAADPKESARFPKIRDYELFAQLGGGGQAVVYKAKYRQDITRAVKVFRQFSGEERVGHTARILDNLQDEPRIVKIQDIGRTEDGKLFIATNFIDGKTLDAFLDEELRDQSLPAQTVLTLFHKITEIVNFAHMRGVIHGDLKPANVIVDDRGEPHLLDFDLARTGASRSIDSRFIGSLPWAAPEQAAGQQNKIDTRTDVYSLGVILYYMVTGGRFPYAHLDNMAQMLREISHAAVIPPNQRLDQPRHKSESRELRPPEVPINEEIEWIVLRALGRRRDDRFRNAGELGDAINKYLRGEPVRPPRATPGDLGPRYRSLIGAAVLGAALLAFAIAVVAGWWTSHGWWAHDGGAAETQLSAGPSKTEAAQSDSHRSPSPELLRLAAGGHTYQSTFWGPSGQAQERPDTIGALPYTTRFDVRDPPGGSGARNQTRYSLTSGEFRIDVQHHRSGSSRTLVQSLGDIVFIPQANLRFILDGQYAAKSAKSENARLTISMSEDGRPVFAFGATPVAKSGELEAGKRYDFAYRCDLETPAGENTDVTAEGSITMRFAKVSPAQAAGG